MTQNLILSYGKPTYFHEFQVSNSRLSFFRRQSSTKFSSENFSRFYKMSFPLISVICPTTTSRKRFHESLYRNFINSTYPNKELIVLQTPDNDSPLAQISDPRLKFVSTAENLTTGEKRNRLLVLSSGSIIAHFDDDDYYSPEYLEVMFSNLGDYDLIKLTSWSFYSLYTKETFSWHRDDFGFGFTYVYRKDLCQIPFPNVNWGEDSQWIEKCLLSDRKLKKNSRRRPGNFQTDCRSSYS